MILQDGDRVLLQDNNHAEVVGTRTNGYDVIRLIDSKVFRNVERDRLELITF